MPDTPAEVIHALMSEPLFQPLQGRIYSGGIYGFELVIRPAPSLSVGFDWIHNVITRADWLVTSQATTANKEEIFRLEPACFAAPALGRMLFHVTHKTNLPTIWTDGIEPRTGNGTWMGRS